VLANTLHFVIDEMLKLIRNEKYEDVKHFLNSLGQSMFPSSEAELKLLKVFLSFSHASMFNSNYRDILTSYVHQMEHFFRSELEKIAPRSVKQESITAVSSFLLPMMDGIGLHYLLSNDDSKLRQTWKLQLKSIYQLLGISQHPDS
jgi:hypothetical protein